MAARKRLNRTALLQWTLDVWILIWRIHSHVVVKIHRHTNKREIEQKHNCVMTAKVSSAFVRAQRIWVRSSPTAVFFRIKIDWKKMLELQPMDCQSKNTLVSRRRTWKEASFWHRIRLLILTRFACPGLGLSFHCTILWFCPGDSKEDLPDGQGTCSLDNSSNPKNWRLKKIGDSGTKQVILNIVGDDIVQATAGEITQ